jgi:hypothetical protein
MVVCEASGDPGSRGPFTIRVNDTQPPALGTLPPVSGTTDAGKAFAALTLASPGATDNNIGVLLGCDRPFAASPFAIGATTVTCTAADTGGNTATKTTTFTVADAEPPTIIVPGRTDASTTSGDGTTVSYTAPGVVDNSGPMPPAACTPPSGATFPIGTTTVTCTATDSSGNAKTATFPVVVTRLPDAALPPLIPAVPAVQLVDANPSRFSSKKSTRLRYVLNTPGRVAIALRRCTGKGSKPCSKLTAVRTLNTIGAAGLGSLAVAGTGLKAAPYRATFTATDGFGRISKAITAGFTVTK